VKKKQDISPVQFLLVLLGVVAWIIAGYFASQEVAKSVEKEVAKSVEKGGAIAIAMAPNNVAAAGLLGFSIAGGLCFLAVGIGGWKSGSEQPPTTPPNRSNEG
jgi:hypothetical protein